VGSSPLIIWVVSMLECPYRETGWRIRLVDIFEDRRSALGVATPFILRASEDWALRKLHGHGAT
jgi:hypothetical protein